MGQSWFHLSRDSMKCGVKNAACNISAIVRFTASFQGAIYPIRPCQHSIMEPAYKGIHILITVQTSNGSWCMGIKGEMSGTVCVTFTWDMYIYIWVVYSLCFICCLFITVTWWCVWCFEWASGNQEEVQACLVTLWLFIISCYSLYKTTLGLLCSWFENNPHFHKYSMDFHV